MLESLWTKSKHSAARPKGQKQGRTSWAVVPHNQSAEWRQKSKPAFCLNLLTITEASTQKKKREKVLWGTVLPQNLKAHMKSKAKIKLWKLLSAHSDEWSDCKNEKLQSSQTTSQCSYEDKRRGTNVQTKPSFPLGDFWDFLECRLFRGRCRRVLHKSLRRLLFQACNLSHACSYVCVLQTVWVIQWKRKWVQQVKASFLLFQRCSFQNAGVKQTTGRSAWRHLKERRTG